MGYLRADGRAATRNEIWVLPTVGCVARTAAKIAEAADRRHRGRIDGVNAFTHPFGCSQLGEDLNGTRAIRSEEHTSELQSLMRISYAVFCLKNKKKNIT